MSTAVRIKVTCWQCPHCHRTHAKHAAADGHIARCWLNPATRSCKTCTRLEDVPDGAPCFPGVACDCNEGYRICAAAVPLRDRAVVVGCPLWTPTAALEG